VICAAALAFAAGSATPQAAGTGGAATPGTNTIKYRTHAGPGRLPGPRTYPPDLDGIATATSG
jgi:hypothetical protein